jgi:hypothetical protein
MAWIDGILEVPDRQVRGAWSFSAGIRQLASVGGCLGQPSWEPNLFRWRWLRASLLRPRIVRSR